MVWGGGGGGGVRGVREDCEGVWGCVREVWGV